MTISSSVNRVQYSGDGSSIEFPFTFGTFSVDDLDVILTDALGVDTTLTRGVDYDVTLTEPTMLPSAGLVIFIGDPSPTPPASGEKLTIIRVLDYTQEVDITDGGPLPASSLDEAHDRAVMLIQQLKELLGRTLMLPTTSVYSNLSLPDPLAYGFMRWKADESGLENVWVVDVGELIISPFIVTLADDEDASTALTTLGFSAYGKTLIDDADASAARGTLGLGTMATETATDYVAKALFDANTILAATTDNNPAAVTVAEQTILGRITGGNIDDLTITQVLDMVGSAAEGDILYRGSAAWSRLAKGLKKMRLQQNTAETAPEWGSTDITIPQTVLSAFTDAHGFPDFLWNGQEDFAPVKVPTTDAICDSYTSTYYSYNAFDGSDSTFWQSACAAGSTSGVAYIGVKNLKRNIKAIKYLNNSSTSYGITSVKIDYSTDNGVTWTNIQTTTVVTTASMWQEFTVATYATGDAGLHSIRILANANPVTAWAVHTLILLYNSNLDVCTTGNAVKYDENGSYPATNAFDNVESTYYQSSTNMNTGNHYLGQSGLASAVKAIRFRQSSSGMSECKLSWKQNVGDSWTDLATVALDKISGTAIWQTISVPSYSPSGSHYFAIRPTTNCVAAVWVLFSLEFYCGDDTAISMTASATDPLTLVHSSGTDNFVTEVTSSEASLVSSLVPGRTHFIYADRNASTGAITYGSKPVCPQYGKEFDATKHCLLHFEGADASTVITDEYGSTWTANGNAQLDNNATPGPKFGSTYLRLDGTGDSIKNTDRYWFNGQPFTIEGWWFTANQATANQMVMSTIHASGYPVYLRYTSANLFGLQLSSNNSSMDICDITSAYTVANNTWYKFIFEWDGYYYRVWIGTSTATMVLIFNVKSSTPLYTGQIGLEFGAYNSGGGNPVNGGFDEIRITLGSNRYGWSPVAETSAFDKYDSDMTYFDINKMKMYYGGGSSWTEVQRLFLGEAYMDCHGVTDMRNYALQGKYEGLKKAILVNTNYSFNHNLGCIGSICKTVLVNKVGANGWKPGEVIDEITLSSVGLQNGSFVNRKVGHVGTGSEIYVIDRSSSGGVAITTANYEQKQIAQRGW